MSLSRTTTTFSCFKLLPDSTLPLDCCVAKPFLLEGCEVLVGLKLVEVQVSVMQSRDDSHNLGLDLFDLREISKPLRRTMDWS